MRFAVCVNPGLAVIFLRALATYGLSPACVVTPHPPCGRWRWQPGANEITRFAQAQGWPLLRVRDAQDVRLRQTLQREPVDWLCVFGFAVLPETVLALPRLGALSLHPSLLPTHRGAYPTYWSLRAGETHSGFSLIQLAAGIDTGAIIEQHPMLLDSLDDAETALHRLCTLGAKSFVRRLLRLAAGEPLPLTPQATRTRYEPIPTPASLRLTSDLSRVELEQQVAAAKVLGGARWCAADGSCWRVLDVMHLQGMAVPPTLAAGRRLLPWPGQRDIWLVVQAVAC